jgi:Penicillin binding protein transpeptidase domain/Penicillin-binding Protein dimerisation domain/NTF2-like N-terminal transpeptidase domain
MAQSRTVTPEYKHAVDRSTTFPLVSELSAEVERRRRLLTRTLPLALVALVAFIIGAAMGAPGSPQKESADRFTAAWAAGKYPAMYEELNDASKAKTSLKGFTAAYREAKQIATLRGLEPGSPHGPQSQDGTTVVPVPLTVSTVAFGRLEDELILPFADGGVAWDPSLVFPGLSQGEQLGSEIELAPRASILAADGTPLAEGPAEEREHPLGSAAIDVTGEVGEPSEEDIERLARKGFSTETPVGISGLERAFNTRLAGKPGGALLAEDAAGTKVRVIAESKPEAGAPVKTTIDAGLQEQAVASLAGRAGGVVVLDARNGDVRALAGQAFSAPQPPGSTFKIITTTAALQDNIVELDDEFEISDGINVGGRFINNANGEFCGGTFAHSFAESCNAVFAPLGPQVGNDDLVGTAERFGFNSPPTLYAPELVREAGLPESTIPTEIPTEIELGVSAIGQGEVLATPLEMASVAQTVANGGVRMPTSIVNNEKLRPTAKPERVMSKQIADELTELMVGVVVEGTGYAAAISEAQVAGKTGTAELGPKPGQEDEDNPVQIKDAWFSAFAPAEKPKLAVGVLLIEAEAAGGEVAAPIAGELLSAGL